MCFRGMIMYTCGHSDGFERFDTHNPPCHATQCRTMDEAIYSRVFCRTCTSRLRDASTDLRREESIRASRHGGESITSSMSTSTTRHQAYLDTPVPRSATRSRSVQARMSQSTNAMGTQPGGTRSRSTIRRPDRRPYESSYDARNVFHGDRSDVSPERGTSRSRYRPYEPQDYNDRMGFRSRPGETIENLELNPVESYAVRDANGQITLTVDVATVSRRIQGSRIRALSPDGQRSARISYNDRAQAHAISRAFSSRAGNACSDADSTRDSWRSKYH